MSRDDSELLEHVLQLPQAVRAQFAQEILASLDGPAETGVEERWQAEIEHRAEDVLAGRAELEDVDAVHARITANLRARAR